MQVYDDVVKREGPEEDYEWPWKEDNKFIDVRTHVVWCWNTSLGGVALARGGRLLYRLRHSYNSIR